MTDELKADVDTRCVWTAETAGEAELRELFSMDPDDDPLADVVRVCDGEWRYDGNGVWRLWKMPDAADGEDDRVLH